MPENFGHPLSNLRPPTRVPHMLKSDLITLPYLSVCRRIAHSLISVYSCGYQQEDGGTHTQSEIEVLLLLVSGVGYSCHSSEGRSRYSEGASRGKSRGIPVSCTCLSLDGRSNIIISVTWTLREWCSYVFFTPSRSLRARIRTPSRSLWDGVGNLARS